MKIKLRNGSLLAVAFAFLAVSCTREEPAQSETASTGKTTLSVGLPASVAPQTASQPQQNAPVSKTSLGPSSGGSRKVFWSNGDRIRVNGVASDALSGIPEESTSADFTFDGVINPPMNILYPSSFYKNAEYITLPATQSYAAGTIATNTVPMSGYKATAGSGASLRTLTALVRISVSKNSGVTASTLTKVTFKGNDGEQIVGDFAINYQTGTLTATTTAENKKSVSMSPNQALSTTATEIILSVPARTYAKGFSISLEDNYGRSLTKTKSTSVTLQAGNMANMTAFTFVPSDIATEFDIADITEEHIVPDYNVTGRVVDNSGNPIEGVVVSDGILSVRTNADGNFYINSSRIAKNASNATTSDTTFVYISTPSGYKNQEVVAGIPKFYKKRSEMSKSGNIYNCGNFTLTPVNDSHFTLLVTADPQPRKHDGQWASIEKTAYRSLRLCQSLYRDLKETAASKSTPVYGLCLGDLVHEDMSLLDTYISDGMNTVGYPTFNVLGNHDNDPSASNDGAGAIPFMTRFGPRNYSFNIGGVHFVVLDNLMMYRKDGQLTGFNQGINDEVWEWLQGDMAYIPTTTKVMVAAHSPMFKYITGSERTNTARHGPDYGALFDKYSEVHAWAGHTHIGFNFVYSQNHRHRNVQVHTLARSTGELWTNEYLAEGGTPRGFTVVDVNNGTISWKFHPTKYLNSSYHGTQGQPTLNLCEYIWSDTSPSVAQMKNTGNGDTGQDLSEAYQMHVFAPGTYSQDTGSNTVYANIFLWDEKWKTPTFTPTGGSAMTMERISGRVGDTDNPEAHDAAGTEMRTFYNAKYSILRSGCGYTASIPGIQSIFKATGIPSSCHSGTVRVEDRFGNVYTRYLSW
ncbi:MAG: calcineurin-like phosphoesterase C-terminal domain-containing protein [Bacteroidales bacterium]|nr:calcineurin-like phosphoesterase C-terminal domain-containing protein [Bacteroidales bacterium]